MCMNASIHVMRLYLVFPDPWHVCLCICIHHNTAFGLCVWSTAFVLNTAFGLDTAFGLLRLVHACGLLRLV